MRRRESDKEASIDLTSMLDIVFIMLIFFIVTTSFVKESGIEVNRPTTKSASVEEKGSIIIAISANGEIWIDKHMVDIRAVRAHILRLKASMPEASVLIESDTLAKTGLLVEVMDQVRLAGIDGISIATKSEH